MKFLYLILTAFLLVSCSSKDVKKVDKKAEEMREKIKKDKDYCSPMDKTLNTEGCED